MAYWTRCLVHGQVVAVVVEHCCGAGHCRAMAVALPAVHGAHAQWSWQCTTLAAGEASSAAVSLVSVFLGHQVSVCVGRW